jgi:hypothetical protein
MWYAFCFFESGHPNGCFFFKIKSKQSQKKGLNAFCGIVISFLHPKRGIFALGIAVEIFCEATNKRLQRIARPVGERPKKLHQITAP